METIYSSNIVQKKSDFISFLNKLSSTEFEEILIDDKGFSIRNKNIKYPNTYIEGIFTDTGYIVNVRNNL